MQTFIIFKRLKKKTCCEQLKNNNKNKEIWYYIFCVNKKKLKDWFYFWTLTTSVIFPKPSLEVSAFKFLKKVRQLNRNRYEIRVFLTKWHYRLADTFIRSFVFCKRLLAGANLEPTMGILSMRQEYSPWIGLALS